MHATNRSQHFPDGPDMSGAILAEAIRKRTECSLFQASATTRLRAMNSTRNLRIAADIIFPEIIWRVHELIDRSN
jgi:hypothetical protein